MTHQVYTVSEVNEGFARTVSKMVHFGKVSTNKGPILDWVQACENKSLIMSVGDIDAISMPNLNDEMTRQTTRSVLRGIPQLAGMAASWSRSKRLSRLNAQLLTCRGAAFHTDSHFWIYSLFLTCYLSGPAMDFVIPHIGYRQTINPGDCFAFDPALPHGLLNPGKTRAEFDQDQPCCHFISIDIEMTPQKYRAMGIESLKTPISLPQGHMDITLKEVNAVTGEFKD